MDLGASWQDAYRDDMYRVLEALSRMPNQSGTGEDIAKICGGTAQTARRLATAASDCGYVFREGTDVEVQCGRARYVLGQRGQEALAVHNAPSAIWLDQIVSEFGAVSLTRGTTHDDEVFFEAKVTHGAARGRTASKAIAEAVARARINKERDR